MVDWLVLDLGGGVFRQAERSHGGELGVPGAGRLQPTNQQPGGERGSGGGSGQLHYDHQDAAATAEVETETLFTDT